MSTGLPHVSDLLAALAELPPELLLAVTGLVVLGECTVGLGFLVPGESALLVAATTATTPGRAAALWAVVTCCAAAGDAIGYRLGRRAGPRLLRSRLLARAGGPQGAERAARLLRRHGAWAVLGARFLPVVRTLVPATAGVAGLPARRFAVAALVGAALWSAVHVALGAALGEAAGRVEEVLGTGGLVVLLVLAAVLVGVFRRRSAAPSVVGRGGDGGARSAAEPGADRAVDRGADDGAGDPRR